MSHEPEARAGVGFGISGIFLSVDIACELLPKEPFALYHLYPCLELLSLFGATPTFERRPMTHGNLTMLDILACFRSDGKLVSSAAVQMFGTKCEINGQQVHLGTLEKLLLFLSSLISNPPLPEESSRQFRQTLRRRVLED